MNEAFGDGVCRATAIGPSQIAAAQFVVEVILERVTNIAVGSQIERITELE